MWGGGMMNWGFGWGGWGLAWPFQLLLLLLLAVCVAMLFRRVPGATRHRRVRKDRAVAILRERYAHGEIEQAEFEAQLRRLRG